jgi:hypothetical protein
MPSAWQERGEFIKGLEHSGFLASKALSIGEHKVRYTPRAHTDCCDFHVSTRTDRRSRRERIARAANPRLGGSSRGGNAYRPARVNDRQIPLQKIYYHQAQRCASLSATHHDYRGLVTRADITQCHTEK